MHDTVSSAASNNASSPIPEEQQQYTMSQHPATLGPTLLLTAETIRKNLAKQVS